MTNLKTVTLNLEAVSIKVTGNTSEELLENAKKAFIEQITAETMPRVVSYSVGEADALSFDTVFAGQIVESNDGKLGIVSQVNKKTIYVTYTNGTTVSAPPTIYKASDATFEQARNRRNPEAIKMNFWSDGNTGYIKVKNEIREIIIGKISRGKAKLLIVGTQKYVSVSEEQMEKILKDEKNDIK